MIPISRRKFGMKSAVNATYTPTSCGCPGVNVSSHFRRTDPCCVRRLIDCERSVSRDI
ncbi:hypothetical protein BD309DRAFT_946273 [Dichomitus squalens]|uniref:Uncharacterized protein n=1 Tax=Dichomitus squalens TaxID=114155 RepID=A0A4V2K610_9APHY|nr:hypothetical protein BD309DRAFT_946273 [Dichomitus squalens]TBU62120.1 hypothetical protein BD310DRAFT_919642 [Dichomitus squalens]